MPSASSKPTATVVGRKEQAQLSPYQTRRLKRFGKYTLSMSTPDPFETELVVPFPLVDPRSRPPAPDALFPSQVNLKAVADAAV